MKHTGNRCPYCGVGRLVKHTGDTCSYCGIGRLRKHTGDKCPYCKVGRLELIVEREPYSIAHLQCSDCCSTYNLEEEMNNEEHEQNIKECEEEWLAAIAEMEDARKRVQVSLNILMCAITNYNQYSMGKILQSLEISKNE